MPSTTFGARRFAITQRDDITELVRRRGGDARVLGIYDHRRTTSAGITTAWDDARGATGYGASLPAIGTTKPVKVSDGIVTDGIDNGFQSAVSSQFDLSLGRTIIVIMTLEASNGWAFSVNDSPVTKSVGLDCRTSMKLHTPVDVVLPTARSTTMRCVYISRSVAAPYTGIPSGQQAQFMVHGRIGSGDGTGGDKYHLDQTTTVTLGSWRLCLGHQAGVANHSKIRAVIVLDHPLTGDDWADISNWARTIHGAVPDYSGNNRLLLFHGNSIQAGFGAGAGNCMADLTFADAIGSTNLDYVSGGLNSLPGDHLADWDFVKMHPALKEPGYSKRGYIWWEGTVRRFAGATAAQTIEDARRACANAKAQGATFTIALTEIPRFNLSGAQNTERLGHNSGLISLASVGSAIDAVADVATVSFMSDPNDTAAYWDGIHPTGAGQQAMFPTFKTVLANFI